MRGDVDLKKNILDKIKRYFKYIIVVFILLSVIIFFVTRREKYSISPEAIQLRIIDNIDIYEEDFADERSLIGNVDENSIRWEIEKEPDGEYGKYISLDIVYKVEKKEDVPLNTYADIQLSEDAKRYFCKKQDIKDDPFMGEWHVDGYTSCGRLALEGCLRDASPEEIIELLHGSKVTVTLIDAVGNTKEIEYYVDKEDVEIIYEEL